MEEPVVYKPTTRPAMSRLSILDGYEEAYAEFYSRWTVERPQREGPEAVEAALEIMWESLGQG